MPASELSPINWRKFGVDPDNLSSKVCLLRTTSGLPHQRLAVEWAIDADTTVVCPASIQSYWQSLLPHADVLSLQRAARHPERVSRVQAIIDSPSLTSRSSLQTGLCHTIAREADSVFFSVSLYNTEQMFAILNLIVKNQLTGVSL